LFSRAFNCIVTYRILMKRPVLLKIVLLLLLYGAVFTIIVMIQFARKGSFTQRIGPLVVSGQYRRAAGQGPLPGPNEYLLEGDVSVFFGGMEFRMGAAGEESVLRLFGGPGEGRAVLPERMTVSDESAVFGFSGGTGLVFSVRNAGDVPELRISCDFAEGEEELELPYKPQRKTGMRDLGDGRFVIISGGVNYSFGRSPLDSERRLLFLTAGGSALSYGAVPERRAFNPADFIIPQAQSKRSYDETVARWTTENFSLWNRAVASANDEDLVIAYSREAINRGTYSAAVSAVPAGFLDGGNRTFESSVYLGRLDPAYRSLDTSDREKLGRLSRLVAEKSPEFLREPHGFEYFAVRGHGNFMDQGADLARSVDPATMSLDLVPGVLEGYTDWKTYRPHMENPFERLLEQACFVISENLIAVPGGDRVFAFYGSQAEAEFNMRLGRALLGWAEAAGEASWTGVARSLILSVLSLGDSGGTVKAGMAVSEDGQIVLNESPSRLTGARLYRILNSGEYSPRALPIGAAVNSIWTWTAARSVSAVQENNILDISVSFVSGETHYMILRGIRAFTKIQLYGMDFRTDPQFERYDSSGWRYIAGEQTLIVKMKHRNAIEHVRIFY
jgi:hypothetical protein